MKDKAREELKEKAKVFFEKVSPSSGFGVREMLMNYKLYNLVIETMCRFATEQLKNTLNLESKIKEDGTLGIGQHLFEQLIDTCDFTALQDDMNQIINAVLRDNPDIKQMPSIIRELKEEIDRLKKQIRTLTYSDDIVHSTSYLMLGKQQLELKERDETIRELREHTTNQFIQMRDLAIVRDKYKTELTQAKAKNEELKKLCKDGVRACADFSTSIYNTIEEKAKANSLLIVQGYYNWIYLDKPDLDKILDRLELDRKKLLKTK